MENGNKDGWSFKKLFKSKAAKKESGFAEKAATMTMLFLFGCLVGGYLVGNLLQYMILLENVQNTTSIQYTKVFEEQTKAICGVANSSAVISTTNLKMKPISDIVSQKIIPAVKTESFAKVAVFGIDSKQVNYYKQIQGIIGNQH